MKHFCGFRRPHLVSQSSSLSDDPEEVLLPLRRRLPAWPPPPPPFPTRRHPAVAEAADGEDDDGRTSRSCDSRSEVEPDKGVAQNIWNVWQIEISFASIQRYLNWFLFGHSPNQSAHFNVIYFIISKYYMELGNWNEFHIIYASAISANKLLKLFLLFLVLSLYENIFLIAKSFF